MHFRHTRHDTAGHGHGHGKHESRDGERRFARGEDWLGAARAAGRPPRRIPATASAACWNTATCAS